MHLRQSFTRDALFEEVTKNIFDLARAANHAHVPCVGFECRLQRVLIEMVAACNNHNPAGLVGLQLANRLRDISKGQLHLIAKSLWIGQVTPVIYHHNAKVQLRHQPDKGLRHIASTGNNQPWFREQHLDEQLKSSPTTTYSLFGIQVYMSNVRTALA